MFVLWAILIVFAMWVIYKFVIKFFFPTLNRKEEDNSLEKTEGLVTEASTIAKEIDIL